MKRFSSLESSSLVFKPLILCSFLLLILPSCGGDEYQEDIKKESFEKIQEEITEEKQKAESKRKQRIVKGDTIAIDHKTLQDFLPKNIDGYTPEGQIVSSEQSKSGKAFSNVEQSYQKDGKHLLIAIIDYSGANSQFAQEVAFWNSGLKINNRSTEAGGIDLDGFKGWEIYEKKIKIAKLHIALSDRILLKMTASHQKNTEYLKKIIQEIDLNKLAHY